MAVFSLYMSDNIMDNNIYLQKAALRKRVLSSKADYSGLCDKFFSLPQVAAARKLLLFYGVGREPDTVPLIRRLIAAGKTVALPVCLPGKRMEARIISSAEEAVPGAFGIPEPAARCPAIERDAIDLILVPNVCCDRQNHRLGHGGGYYDRYLRGYRGTTVSLCPKSILFESIPTDVYDIPVDIVIS